MTHRTIVAFFATLVALSFSYAARAEIRAPEVSGPAACSAETSQRKDCSRWYNLSEKSNPDACQGARMSGEKCGRWYSVGAPAPVVIVLRGINFDTAKSNIRAESIPILESNVKGLQQKSRSRITIEGHTDARGSDAYNQGLSEARANSVLNWFAAHGIERNRMSAVGKGESQPTGSNSTEEGMYQNRRIELHLN